MVGGGRRHIGPPVTAQVRTDDRAAGGPQQRCHPVPGRRRARVPMQQHDRRTVTRAVPHPQPQTTDLDPLITEAGKHRAILSAHTLPTGLRRRLETSRAEMGLGTGAHRQEGVEHGAALR
jgi:hypothetical protein